MIVGDEAISPSEFLEQWPISPVRVQMLIASVYGDLLAMHRHTRVRFCLPAKLGRLVRVSCGLLKPNAS